MNLAEQLATHKKAIVKKWLDRVIDTYPAETARFLRSQQDPFTNPVGQNTRQSLETLIDLLGSELDDAAVLKALDPVIRIRAVQTFTPSQAVGFIFELKEIVSRILPGKDHSDRQAMVLARRIDGMALLAFDLFMQCREKIYELKAGEMKERTYKAFARAGLVKDPP